jgi:hypothetical protein
MIGAFFYFGADSATKKYDQPMLHLEFKIEKEHKKTDQSTFHLEFKIEVGGELNKWITGSAPLSAKTMTTQNKADGKPERRNSSQFSTNLDQLWIIRKGFQGDSTPGCCVPVNL